MGYEVSVKKEISSQMLADLVTSACEHNDMMAGWCTQFHDKTGWAERNPKSIWYADPKYWDQEVISIEVTTEDDPPKRISNLDIQIGYPNWTGTDGVALSSSLDELCDREP